jgi:hypothetical protein
MNNEQQLKVVPTLTERQGTESNVQGLKPTKLLKYLKSNHSKVRCVL